MKLIKEIEIAYFRSFYKVSLIKCSDLNIIFGKNDVGKSNVIRALSLFFNNETEDSTDFDFLIDFCERRLDESQSSEGIRKFIYVKITFNTPENYRKSLGKEFYVKRQWTVSRGDSYVEEISSNVKSSQRHIVTRLVNQIKFIHIRAIKDRDTFRKLLNEIYQILSEAPEFLSTVEDFTTRVQNSTSELFYGMPAEVAHRSKISAPSSMDELFETLDFETVSAEGSSSKSLTLQRGDGIKARHIPEILNFIRNRGGYQFHIWGFEEPENSLDFVSAEAEAKRFQALASEGRLQIFVTTHSPSFYNLSGDSIQKFYVTRDESAEATIVQGKNIERLDVATAIGDGFYLPAVAKALEEYSDREAEVARFKEQIDNFHYRIKEMTKPVLLTEGKTDEIILLEALERLGRKNTSFNIKCCDIVDGKNGGSGGASRLALSLRSVPFDSPNLVIGLFDRDDEGIKEYKLDANFQADDFFSDVKSAKNGRAHALLLPVPEFRTVSAKIQNLQIEHFFPDEYLLQAVKEKKLRLRPLMASRRCGNEMIRIPIGEGIDYQSIDDNTKVEFASSFVPRLPDEAFESFHMIFGRIDDLLKR